MTKRRNWFETCDLLIGRLIALIIAGVGALATLIAFEVSDFQDAFLPFVIGLGLLLLAAALLYWRVSFLNMLQFFTSGGSSS